MDEIVNNRPLRRLFFAFFLLIFALFAVLRYFSIEQGKWLDALWSLGDNLAAEFLGMAIFGAFVFYLAPKVLRAGHIELLEPSKIGPMFESQIRSSNYWMFRGATGRFVRSKVLPAFHEMAVRDRKPRFVRLILLNPGNQAACAAYAAYRARVDPLGVSPKSWDAERVAEEITGTLAAAAHFHSVLVDVEVTLVDWFSAFRADHTTNRILVTKEDPSSRAITCDADHEAFQYFSLDAQVIASQGRQLALGKDCFDLGTADEAKLKSLMASLGILINPTSSEFWRDALGLAKLRRNPYGK